MVHEISLPGVALIECSSIGGLFLFHFAIIKLLVNGPTQSGEGYEIFGNHRYSVGAILFLGLIARLVSGGIFLAYFFYYSNLLQV